MSTKQSIFNKLIVEYDGIKCIKRSEKVFIPYIGSIAKKNIFINPSVLMASLDKLIELLKLHDPSHVVILNENQELKSILNLFKKLTGFNLVSYKIGMFNNTAISYFCNATCVISFHDRRDRAAIINAKKANIKIYGLNNLTRGYRYFDYFVPINNFSLNTITLITWYITYSMQEASGKYPISFDEYYTLIYG